MQHCAHHGLYQAYSTEKEEIGNLYTHATDTDCVRVACMCHTKHSTNEVGNWVVHNVSQSDGIHHVAPVNLSPVCTLLDPVVEDQGECIHKDQEDVQPGFRVLSQPSVELPDWALTGVM